MPLSFILAEYIFYGLKVCDSKLNCRSIESVTFAFHLDV